MSTNNNNLNKENNRFQKSYNKRMKIKREMMILEICLTK